MILKGLICNV